MSLCDRVSSTGVSQYTQNELLLKLEFFTKNKEFKITDCYLYTN